MWKFWRKKPARIERFGCKSKDDVLNHLNYMVLYAPNFPVEDETDLDFAFACLEFGLARIEQLDGRPAVCAMLSRVHAELARSKSLFESGEIIPACHALQDAEDILAPVRVKSVVA